VRTGKTPSIEAEAANVSVRTVFARACLIALVSGMPLAEADPQTVEPAPPDARVTRPPLDLSVGRLNGFMAPKDWFLPLPSEIDEVIVRGRRQPGEIPYRQSVPQGLGGLLWGLRNPIGSWRLLLPDPNVSVPDRDGDESREPPGAHRVRIGEPGKIY
jgi:hypothetical protein